VKCVLCMGNTWSSFSENWLNLWIQFAVKRDEKARLLNHDASFTLWHWHSCPSLYALTLLSASAALLVLTGAPKVVIHVLRFRPFFVFIWAGIPGHMAPLACFGTFPATRCWPPNQSVRILQQCVQVSVWVILVVLTTKDEIPLIFCFWLILTKICTVETILPQT